MVDITHATAAGAGSGPGGTISGTEWEEAHDLTGTIPVANLPVGTTSSDVAAGDHTHATPPAIAAGAVIYAYNTFR